MRGKELLPYTYRDFGSLDSLGKWSTVGSLMRFLFGPGFFVEGLVAQIMYRSFRVMQDLAVGGSVQALPGILVRALANRAGPRVELH
jgi:NADH:ubiquinone reductase (H+-translocating)